jgi:hypothetical protein
VYRYFHCCHGKHLPQTFSNGNTNKIMMSVDSVIFIKPSFMEISKENIIQYVVKLRGVLPVC